MQHILKSFFRRDDGAISVDWVVLTAALVGLAAGGGATTLAGINTAAGTISSEVSTKSVENGD